MPEWKGRVPLTRSHCERITRIAPRAGRAAAGRAAAHRKCTINEPPPPAPSEETRLACFTSFPFAPELVVELLNFFLT
ncbi:hypothetical protein EVAR_74536_1 [Eumeta japonica]|uniref:Uncharacterized protein n=1 Tax=Eumeta variegata TaxID=151549 RepID=A0A4C1TCI6_EUMVA|nr:hypothetical protein EVAR_74536_1 [Eumeta japonica]